MNLWEAPVRFKPTESHHLYQNARLVSVNKAFMAILRAINPTVAKRYFTLKTTKTFLQRQSHKRLQK